MVKENSLTKKTELFLKKTDFINLLNFIVTYEAIH